MIFTQHRYLAFGVRIKSDMALPELHTYSGDGNDVEIKYGEVPKKTHSLNEQNEMVQAGRNKFLLRIDGVASYYVADGKQIIVQLFNQNLHLVKLYLLGTVMGVLLMQRGILPLHGSTVVVEEHCIMFVGDSGAGKSTLAAALRNKGHSMLADDISAVELDKFGLPWVHPGYPQQKLWQTSAEMLGIDTTSLSRICNDINKYAVPAHIGFWRKPMLLKAIYEVCVQANDSRIVPIEGVKKLVTIMHHTYRGEVIEGLGLKPSHFQSCAALAKGVPLFQMTRPERVQSLDIQVNILERHLADLFGICRKPISAVTGGEECETSGD